jgi:hypothetical protein
MRPNQYSSEKRRKELEKKKKKEEKKLRHAELKNHVDSDSPEDGAVPGEPGQEGAEESTDSSGDTAE